jgi:hypothetical protein
VPEQLLVLEVLVLLDVPLRLARSLHREHVLDMQCVLQREGQPAITNRSFNGMRAKVDTRQCNVELLAIHSASHWLTVQRTHRRVGLAVRVADVL